MFQINCVYASDLNIYFSKQSQKRSRASSSERRSNLRFQLSRDQAPGSLRKSEAGRQFQTGVQLLIHGEKQVYAGNVTS